jgi:hypothetical protein
MRFVKLLYIALILPLFAFSQELPHHDLSYICSSERREFYWNSGKLYELIDTVTITFYCEAKFYLLYQVDTDRYAVYYDFNDFNVQETLLKKNEMPLDTAKRVFPWCNLHEHNYGFKN